ALIATIRRTPAARIAVMIAAVPGAAIPASELLWGPSADSTASAPTIAVSKTCGPGLARSAVTTRAAPAARTSGGGLAGARGTAGVGGGPGFGAGRGLWGPPPPVAAMIVSFMMSSLFCVLFPSGGWAGRLDGVDSGQIGSADPDRGGGDDQGDEHDDGRR